MATAPSSATSTDLTMPSSVIGRLISGSFTVARAAPMAVRMASVLADKLHRFLSVARERGLRRAGRGLLARPGISSVTMRPPQRTGGGPERAYGDNAATTTTRSAAAGNAKTAYDLWMPSSYD